MRRASSVILRRGSEMYLAQRSPSLFFFGGFWAGVGGKVSPIDDADAQRVTLPGLPFDLQAFAMAAMRELFEELILEISERRLPDPEAARRAIVAGASLVDHLGDERVRAAGRLRPMLRIQTPAYHSIRFDTQFFLLDWADLPHRPEPAIACDELVDQRWAEPSEWLARWRAGDLYIAPPVLLILQQIAENGWEQGLTALAALEQELNGAPSADSTSRDTREFHAPKKRDGSGAIHPIFHNPAAQLLPVRTPTLPPATHTNCYLVGRDPAYLIDPATPDPGEQDRLLRAIETALPAGLVPERRLHAILLTHHHPDHVGAVERVRRHFGLPVWTHSVTQQLLSGSISVDRTIEDEETLPLGLTPDGRAGWSLRVVFTPGHAAGHLCFLDDRYGSLFAGDMVSTLSSILVRRSDGDMAIYMDSLERLTKLPVRAVFPSHGPADVRGTQVLLDQLAHRQARETAIHDAISQGAKDLDAIVRAVYQDVPVSMHGLARSSVESVCVKLSREGRIPSATAELLLS